MFTIISSRNSPSSRPGGAGRSTSSRKKRRDPDVMDEDEDEVEDAKHLRALGVLDNHIATPGEAIADARDWMRGHGTYVSTNATQEDQETTSIWHPQNAIRASVVGPVERTNKLVSVRTLRGRYRPEVGDLVVGRISSVSPGQKRWRVSCNSRQEGVLMLSSVNLPGGVQRRKQASDEMSMRTFFKEGDLLVCEVQGLFQDGGMSLHTRSLKYGKLRNGRLLTLPTTLIPRLPSHFVSLPKPIGVDLILGLNGWVWVSMPREKAKGKGSNEKERAFGEDREVDEEMAEEVYSDKNDPISPAMHMAISRLSALIILLCSHNLVINPDRLRQAWDASVAIVPEVEGRSTNNDGRGKAAQKDVARLWDRGSEEGKTVVEAVIAEEQRNSLQ